MNLVMWFWKTPSEFNILLVYVAHSRPYHVTRTMYVLYILNEGSRLQLKVCMPRLVDGYVGQRLPTIVKLCVKLLSRFFNERRPWSLSSRRSRSSRSSRRSQRSHRSWLVPIDFCWWLNSRLCILDWWHGHSFTDNDFPTNGICWFCQCVYELLQLEIGSSMAVISSESEMGSPSIW